MNGGTPGQTPSPDDYRTGKVLIKAGMFPANSKWSFLIYSRFAHTCQMEIIVQPVNVQNIPMHIHSDVPNSNLISLDEKYHSFSCDVDYKSKD